MFWIELSWIELRRWSLDVAYVRFGHESYAAANASAVFGPNIKLVRRSGFERWHAEVGHNRRQISDQFFRFDSNNLKREILYQSSIVAFKTGHL